MKKKIELVIAGVMMLMTVPLGCTGSENENSRNYSIEFGLKIEDDAVPKEEEKKAKVYSAHFWDWDEKRMLNILLGDKVPQKEIQASSVAYYCEDDLETQTLLLYDGGEAWGEDGGLDGGFSYSTEKAGQHMNFMQYSYVLSIDPGFLESKGMDIYPNAWERDLEFKSFLDSEQEIGNELEALKLPQLELSKAFSITKEQMQDRIDHFDEETKRDIFDRFRVTKEDECYVMIYNQVVDGIPVVDVYWPEEPRKIGEAPETYVSVLVSESGVMRMEAIGLYTLTGEGEEKDLISCEEALNVIKKEYEYSSNATLENVSLRYVSIKKNNQYELTPAWFFKVKEEKRFQTGTGQASEEISVYYAVHAVTGNIMEKDG